MADTDGDDVLGMPGRAIDEVAYKLEDWDDEAFVDVEEALRAAGVSFRREGFDTLVVAPGDEGVVDRVLDTVEAARAAGAPSGPVAVRPGGEPVIDTRWCPACGAEYTSEVESCADCGVGLVDTPPMADDARNHDELIYELVDWSPEMRNQLSLVLEREGVAHEWEGHDLVVAAAVEEQVDSFIDQVEQGDELPAEAEDVDDEAEYNLLSDLFVAADRLGNDPSDLALCGDLVDAAGPARSMATPFGVDDVAWNRVLAQTAAVVDAIEAEAEDSVVGERARSLSDLLRGYV